MEEIKIIHALDGVKVLKLIKFKTRLFYTVI